VGFFQGLVPVRWLRTFGLSLLAIPSTKFNRPVVCVMEEGVHGFLWVLSFRGAWGIHEERHFLCTVGLRLYVKEKRLFFMRVNDGFR